MHLFVFSLLKLLQRLKAALEEEVFTLLADNVITWQSRKRDPPVWAVNSSATVLSHCSHTTPSHPAFGGFCRQIRISEECLLDVVCHRFSDYGDLFVAERENETLASTRSFKQIKMLQRKINS